MTLVSFIEFLKQSGTDRNFLLFQEEEIVKPKQAKKRKKVMSDSDWPDHHAAINTPERYFYQGPSETKRWTEDERHISFNLCDPELAIYVLQKRLILWEESRWRYDMTHCRNYTSTGGPSVIFFMELDSKLPSLYSKWFQYQRCKEKDCRLKKYRHFRAN